MPKSSVRIAKIVLILFFSLSVFIPVLSLLLQMEPEGWKKVFTLPQFMTAFKNSFMVTSVSTVLSILVSFLLAWCMARSEIKYKGIFSTIFTLPMLIPSMSHGMGLIILFGSNGFFTNLFQFQWNIYGFWGIVIGSVLYSFPVAFLMFLDILRYEDNGPYEAANVLGVPKWNQFLSITLPFLKKPLISIIFAIFTLIITDYGVPLMVGSQYITLPVMMYQEVIGLLDFSKGAIIGTVLLVPAILAFIIDIMNQDAGNHSYVLKPVKMRSERGKDAFSFILCVFTSILIIAPLMSFITLTFSTKYPINMALTFDNIVQTFKLQGGAYLWNSVKIASGVSISGVTLAFLTAYFTVRIPGRFSGALHMISITSLAIPGIVLGLSYVTAFNKSFIYGTLLILIMVNLIHFFASPYLMIYNSLRKVNMHLEEVGETLGIRRIFIIKDVIIPQVKGTLLEMFAYFFVNCMMTISAVAFLADLSNKPLSLMITQFEAQMLIECASFVSLMILTVNLLLKGIIYLVKKRLLEEGDLVDAYERTI